MTASRLTVRKRGTGHSYALDGVRIPGVTTIIGNASEKPGMVVSAAKLTAEWAATHADLIDPLGEAAWIKQASGHYRDEWKRKADRGTDTHALARLALRGEPVDVPSELEGLVRQAVDFMDSWGVVEVAAERPCYSAHWRYGGTFDLIAETTHGATWLLDWKTGKGPYVNQALQLVGYALAECYQDESGDDQPMPPIDKLGFVMLDDDGWQLVPVTRWNEGTKDDRDRLAAVFRSMIPVSNFVEWATPDWRTGEARWPVLGEPIPKAAAS